jgi:exoribonuclease R
MLKWADVPAEITSDLSEHEYSLALASLTAWDVSSKYAEGSFVKMLGASGAVEAETEAILREYRIPTAEFEPAVMACLPDVDDEHPFTIPDEEVRD